MSLEKHHGGWVIIVSFIAGLLLTIMPLPLWAKAWRPDWVAMILIYWCIALPQRVGVATGWLVGVIQDVLTDTLLGQHALTLHLIAFISVKSHRRMRISTFWQQSFWIFIMILVSQAVHTWIHAMLGYPPRDWSFLYPAFSSAILWTWIFIILRDVRRAYQVS